MPADLIGVDPKRKVVFDNAKVVFKCRWTPDHGREVTGDVVLTLVRGKVVMEGGKVIGEPGWGKFVTRRSLS